MAETILELIKTDIENDKVQWKTLGEVAELKRGTSITQKTSTQGIHPVISGGQKPAYFIDKFNREGKTITVAGSGAYAGFVMFWNKPIFVADAFSIKSDENILLQKYVYHFLLLNQQKIFNMKKGSGVPHVYPKDLASLTIPIPPLSTQEKIVKILDKMTDYVTELTAELTAELTLRNKQYSYYRDLLLSFPTQSDSDQSLVVEWKKMGEFGEFVRGNGMQKKDFVETGFPAIHYGQIYTKYGFSADKTFTFVTDELASKLKIADTNDLIIATTSENDEDVCKSVAWTGGKVAISGDMMFFKSEQNVKYLAYYFQTAEFQKLKKKMITGTKVRRVNSASLSNLTVPLPPLKLQSKIVEILDKFQDLTENVSGLLPEEIALRQKQYEYYREQLLTFTVDSGKPASH